MLGKDLPISISQSALFSLMNRMFQQHLESYTEIQKLIVLQLIVQMYNMYVIVLRKLRLHGTCHASVLAVAMHLVVANY